MSANDEGGSQVCETKETAKKARTVVGRVVTNKADKSV